jgi:uncharacterized protein (TIGR02646 family)
MKKVLKSPEPDELTKYKQRYTSQLRKWGKHASKKSDLKSAIQTTLVSDQKGICAYCETRIREKFCSVEHFIPCEQSTREQNYDLDWQNMLAVCKLPGAIEDENVDNSQLPHKYPCCGKAKDNFVPDGRLLNPLELPTSRLFRFKREDGEILPDEANCEKEGIPVASVQFTIQKLGLNVERLKTLRLAVIKKIEEELNFYDDGIIDPTVIEKQVASEYFNNGRENYPRFFTTIRWALSNGAEEHLLDISYSG